MNSELKNLKRKAEEEIKNSPNIEVLNNVRIKYLGRKGKLTKILRSLKDLSLEKRRQIGTEANLLKKEFEKLIAQKNKKFQIAQSTSYEQSASSVLRSKTSSGLNERANYKLQERFDITKPGQRIRRGHLNPLTKIEEEIRHIFNSMNFSVAEGPEIETEYNNFDALNIPKDHPARDEWNTFWLKNHKLLLRTHTSPMQIRYMLSHNPPFQIIIPGRVFRYEATDAFHEINFYQVEGLMVGPEVTLANFKFVVEEFLKKFFGPKIQFRFRPSYFPFVEPGLEVDIKFRGARQIEALNYVDKVQYASAFNQSESEWLEIMGAGMVHRNVFDVVRYNPEQIQGFAFGFGLDRLAMLKYNIPDIRLFYSGDLRFIRQF